MSRYGPAPESDPDRSACERCGAKPWDEGDGVVGEWLPVGRGYYLCPGCAGCDRCGSAPIPTYRVGPHERACAHCLTRVEQLAVGHEATRVEEL